MRITSAKPPSAALFALILAFLLLPPVDSLGAQEEGASSASPFEAFEALHAQIATAAAEGRLPANTGPAADEVAFALERDQIRGGAEIEVLKLEAARFTGERQQEALSGLIRAAAARERRLCAAIRQLEELAAAPIPPPVSEDANKQEREEGKEDGFSIEFEPADLIENPDS